MSLVWDIVNAPVIYCSMINDRKLSGKQHNHFIMQQGWFISAPQSGASSERLGVTRMAGTGKAGATEATRFHSCIGTLVEKTGRLDLARTVV